MSWFLKLVIALLIAWANPLLVSHLTAEVYGDGIFRIPAAGGKATHLFSEPGINCGSPRWSPDGKWVAFDTLPLKPKSGNEYDEAQVVAARVDGSQRIVLGAGGMPTWSPDGESVAWHTYSPSGVVVARLDVEQGKAVGIEQVIDHWGSPVWLKNPRFLISIRNGQLASCDLHTGKETLFLNPSRRLTWGYSISPSENRITYRTTRGELVLAGIGEAASPDKLLATQGAGYSSWSPDGKQIVFAWRPTKHKRSQLYTLKIDSLEHPQLIPGQDFSFDAIQPDWSPDGKTILFRRM